MADKIAIAISSDKALKHIVAACDRIASLLAHRGVAPLVMPPRNRDADYEAMARLMAVASWLESVATLIDGKAVQFAEADVTELATISAATNGVSEHNEGGTDGSLTGTHPSKPKRQR